MRRWKDYVMSLPWNVCKNLPWIVSEIKRQQASSPRIDHEIFPQEAGALITKRQSSVFVYNTYCDM
jgi:hypothetical protein